VGGRVVVVLVVYVGWLCVWADGLYVYRGIIASRGSDVRQHGSA